MFRRHTSFLQVGDIQSIMNNMYSARNNRIAYLEKPATGDEKTIARLLEKIIRAVSAGNVTDFISVFSESARIIISKNSNKEMNKKECFSHLSRTIERIRILSYSDAIIRVVNEEAVVSCSGRITYRNGVTNAFFRYFKCIKEDVAWKINEAGFL